jgi:hypothetical protein
MNDTACIAAFQAAPADDTFAAYLDIVSPECACESHQVSVHCVDPVDSGESVVRVVMDPTHIHTEGGSTRLRSAFFNVAATAGASCLRAERATEIEYQITTRMIIENNPTMPDGQPRKVYGVVKIPVETIRTQMIVLDRQKGETTRAFCVYATGTEDRPNHADVTVNGVKRHPKLTRSKQNRVTETLSKQFRNQLITVEQFKLTADLTAFA